MDEIRELNRIVLRNVAHVRFAVIRGGRNDVGVLSRNVLRIAACTCCAAVLGGGGGVNRIDLRSAVRTIFETVFSVLRGGRGDVRGVG